MAMTCSETINTIVVECPDFTSENCKKQGCPRFLCRVSKRGIDDDGNQLYGGACILNGETEWFDGCLPFNKPAGHPNKPQSTPEHTQKVRSPLATKADLRSAVKTIIRGEDVNATRPGPRLTLAKRRQIEAAETWRKSHAGCTLHNACIRSFVHAKGGYRSAAALYSHMHETEKLGIPTVNS